MSYTSPILYASLMLGVFAAILIFVVALSLNLAIQESIRKGFTVNHIDDNEITALWIYFVVAFIALLLIVWFIQARANNDIDRYVNYNYDV